MKRSLLLAVALVGLLTVATGAAGESRAGVLTIEWRTGGGKLGWADPVTLAPNSPTAAIGLAPTALRGRSPDRRTALLVNGTTGILSFVELVRPRVVGTMRLDQDGIVAAALWPRADRLVVLAAGGRVSVSVIDPLRRTVVSRGSVSGRLGATAVAAGRMVAVLAPASGVGAARLATVGADGSLRVVGLPGVEAGFTPPAEPDGVARSAAPGVALEPRGQRAVVVARDAIVTVDLRTLAVRRLPLAARSPARAEKRYEGWSRTARWLRGDLVAVAGGDSAEGRWTPAGASLVDVTSAELRLLDPHSSGIELVAGTLLAYGASGLRGFTLAGARRFDLLAGTNAGYVQTSGRWAYVGGDNSTRFAVVDVTAGRLAGEARRSAPTIVLR